MEVKRECAVRVCDFCKTDKDVWASCTECGKHICYFCKPKYAREYHHAGSGDGLYCFECIAQMMEKKDPLYLAYLTVEMLKKESKWWYENFKVKTDLADKLLADLVAKRKAEQHGKT